MTHFKTVRMGEIHVVQTKGRLRTLLGSCVGLAIHDRQNSVAGLAHILLSRSDGQPGPPGKYVDTAIAELIRQVREVAGESGRLSAHIAGGANMFGTQAENTVGDLNVESLEADLRQRGIPIISRDCGGTCGRRMTFDVATGTVQVELIKNGELR
jgi:chemotaxis protein CheD